MPDLSPRDAIAAGLADLSLQVTDTDIDRLLHFLELIERWNRVTNLTAVKSLPDMVALHLLDSLAVLPFIKGKTVLDVGSGAGLPGIPLALLSPGKDFILLDAASKRTRFMTQAAIELGLTNVQIVHSRVEDYITTADHVICRAFTSLEEFVSLCGELVNEGGSLLAMKGPAEAGIEAVEGWQLSKHTLNVPQLDGERYLMELTR